MKARAKDILFTSAVIVVIIILGAVIVNMDRIFSTENAQQKFRGMLSSAIEYNISSKQEGTNPNASVTLIEVSDFLCSYCRQAAPDIARTVAYYGDKINFVHISMPGRPGSFEPAEAMECARDQDGFLDYYAILWLNTDYSANSLINYAEQVGLNKALFSYCIMSSSKKEVVQKQLDTAVAMGVSGTPTFFVNNRKLVGLRNFAQLSTEIEAELAEK